MPKRRPRPPYAGPPGADTGWVALKPVSSMGGCTFVLLIIGLICLGAAMAILSSVVRGRQSPDLGLEGNLCALPVSLSALLVGGLFAWLYARSVRTMRLTPEPLLRVSHDTLPVGASFDLHWTIAGSASQIRRLTIRFVGREEATLHSGDGERMTTHFIGRWQVTSGDGDGERNYARAFHRADILDTSDPSAMDEGRARIAVPPGSMHSFAGDHNKIVWLVEVKSDVGSALPVEWQYRILVLPLSPPKEHP